MSRPRAILGLAAAALLVLSSGAHSLLGWPVQRAALAEVHASADLVSGLAMGWHFAGAAILAFGIIAGWTFLRLLRGQPAWTRPVQVIGVVYFLFGIGALVASGFEPFFLIFVIPGAMLLAASLGTGDSLAA
jgi:hypothetical protein